jgi:hypothetical protein
VREYPSPFSEASALKYRAVIGQWQRSHISVQDTSPYSNTWAKPKLSPQQALGAHDVEDPTLSRQSAHRWRWVCQPCAPAAFCSPETLVLYFWYSFLSKAEWNPGCSAVERIRLIEKIHSLHWVSNPQPSGL